MRSKLYVVMLFSLFITSCGTIPKDALRLTQKNLELRQIQQKEYSDITEKQALIASANILQDIGFIIKESEQDLGLLVAEKDRDATNTGENYTAAFLIAALGGNINEVLQKNQKIRVSLITRIINKNSIKIRVTFQRIVTNQLDKVFILEFIKDKEVYRDFFTKLNKSIFLTKQGI